MAIPLGGEKRAANLEVSDPKTGNHPCAAPGLGVRRGEDGDRAARRGGPEHSASEERVPGRCRGASHGPPARCRPRGRCRLLLAAHRLLRILQRGCEKFNEFQRPSGRHVWIYCSTI